MIGQEELAGQENRADAHAQKFPVDLQRPERFLLCIIMRKLKLKPDVIVSNNKGTWLGPSIVPMMTRNVRGF
eukprot:SAG11_NODE_5308_length_1600_cov_1.511659_2_plen_72_part_00